MQIMLLLPRPFPLRLSPSEAPFAAPDLGERNSPPRGNPATSEKKKDVLNVGVGGSFETAPLGVFNMDPKPPGENILFTDGDWSHANTLELSSKEPPLDDAFP